MIQFDRIPEPIFKYWKTFETDKLKVQSCIGSSVNDFETYIFYLGSSEAFQPWKILAFGDKKTILYCWEAQENQFTESEFLKILKMKAFI